MVSGGVTREQVLAALSAVYDPELQRDLVSLGMVRDIAIEGGSVSLTVVLTTPACPLRSQIEGEVTAAVMAIAGAECVTLSWDASVPRDDRLAGRIDVGVRNAIAVGSGKGGVGKSTIAVNLAVSLVQQGSTVGLLDADVYGPNVPIMMGVADRRPRATASNKIEPVAAHGVKLMSIGFLVDEATPVVWRGPMLHTAIRQFLSDVDWGDLDYLIIDLPPGTGDVQITLSQALPLTGAVVVTTPQAVSMADVTKAVAMFQLPEIDVPVLGVVENMSGFVAPDTGQVYDIFGRGGGQAIAAKMNVPYLGAVPIDPEVRVSGDEGTPIVLSARHSPAAVALTAMAQKLAANISVLNVGRPPAPTAPDLRVVK
jgi:ATP-binding protein involved in chromosome partitioning